MIAFVSWPARFAVADPRKLAAYLLDPTSKDGASKAAYLLSYGFGAADLGALRAALEAHAAVDNFVGVRVSDYGLKFRFAGPMSAPNGRDATVLTVWQVDASRADGLARFITLRPGRG